MPEDIVLSTTAFNDAAVCLKKYQYRHVERLIPRPKDVRPTIRRGTWIHRCLQFHDHGMPWLVELDRMAEWAASAEVEGVQALYDETANIVEDYIAFWAQRERHEGGPYTTVGTEYPVFYSPVPGKAVSATIDRIVKDPRGKLWLWERKSTSDIPDADWRCVDPQTLIQYAAARLGNQPMNIAGIIFDYVCTDPGPVVRVYKPVKSGANAGRGGRLYEGVLGKAVSARAFEAAKAEIYKNWQDGPDFHNAEEYVASMRTRLVQPEAWFQRYPILRPDDAVVETLRDVAVAMGNVQRARQSGYYQRSYHPVSCKLFCPYGKLCMREYQLGRPSAALREEMFVIETPDLRAEGRSDELTYSVPGTGAR